MVCLASVLVLDGARSAEGPEGTGVCGVCVCVCRRRNHSETKAGYRCNVEEG
jgi:hypothetical protein